MNQKSLFAHFEPPKGMVGHAGWLSGFTAEAPIVNELAERFCQSGRAARARDGEVRLALLLDRCNEQLRLDAVPGVIHLPANAGDPPYKLMHAKVALLGFRSPSVANEWAIRLVVTTGNWTYSTVCESIDLVWSTEISSGTQDHSEHDTDRADILAASDFFAWLRSHYDDRLTRSRHVHAAWFQHLSEWINTLAPSSATPRFVDTRKRSFIKQLPARIAGVSEKTRRNTIVMGSGFWEGGPSSGLPKVPDQVISTLRTAKLLTANVEVNLVVDRECAGVLANELTFNAMEESGWCIRPPGRGPQDHPASGLHAKFLFSAGYSESTDKCTDAWVYLGSGNLTPAGFLQSLRNGGNLEAGIVMGVKGLEWGRHGRGKISKNALRHYLPIDWKSEPETSVAELDYGTEPPARPVTFIATAISHLVWEPTDKGGLLTLPEEERQNIDGLQVFDANETACRRNKKGQYIWTGSQPPMVAVSMSDGALTYVPVLDPNGRLGAVELEPIGLDEAIDLLLGFPASPLLDDSEDVADYDFVDGATDSDEVSKTVPEDQYNPAGPSQTSMREEVRRLMRLVEAIADRQTSLQVEDWGSWCERLKRVLSQLALPASSGKCEATAKIDPCVAFARRVGINPLAPLRHAPFRPDFALDGDAAGKLDRVLDEVEVCWGVEGLEPLGGRL